MKEVTKKVLLVAMMIVSLIILTGCVNVDMEVSVNADGSGEISYILGYNKEFLSSMGTSIDSLTQDNNLEESMESAKKDGYTVEPYEDSQTYGFKASKHVDNVLSVATQTEIAGEGQVPTDGGVTYEKKLLKTLIAQDSKMDLSSVNAGNSMGAAMTNAMLSQMHMTYRVKLPFRVGESNATTVSEDGRTLEWTLKPGEVNEIRFTAVQDFSLYVVAACVVIIVVIALVVLIVAEKRKKSKNKTDDEEKPNEEQ